MNSLLEFDLFYILISAIIEYISSWQWKAMDTQEFLVHISMFLFKNNPLMHF